jgi:hypothetical protein
MKGLSAYRPAYLHQLIGRLCLSSEKLSSRCFPLFERALSKGIHVSSQACDIDTSHLLMDLSLSDLESIRVMALKIICDICFFYPSLSDIELLFSSDTSEEPTLMCFTTLIHESLLGS